MAGGDKDNHQSVNKNLDGHEQSRNRYLTACANADYFEHPRPEVYKKLKKRMTETELFSFLQTVETQDIYNSHLRKLMSHPRKQTDRLREKHRPRIINNIPEMPIRKTITLWENCISILESSKKHKLHVEARIIIATLNKEWEIRTTKERNSDDYFSWPTIEAELGDGSISTGMWLKEGMLKHMGYKVGRVDGKGDKTRKKILSEVFHGILPPVLPRKYMKEWHHPGTSHRLKKMAETIAAFIRNAKRRHDSRMDIAIDQWEHDLDYLYYQYYVGKFYFSWPTAKTT